MTRKIELTESEKILREAGIRATAIRILILETINEKLNGTFSLQDITDIIVTLDSSTVYRTLNMFAEKKLLHLIDDGSGMQKYCICGCKDKDHHQGHVHISCTVCHNTICLKEVPIPAVPIPYGFDVLESEYVIKCICPSCKRKMEAKAK